MGINKWNLGSNSKCQFYVVFNMISPSINRFLPSYYVLVISISKLVFIRYKRGVKNICKDQEIKNKFINLI